VFIVSCACGDCRYYVDHYNTDRKFKFTVDEVTGTVKIRNELDPDVSRNFNLQILAVDEGKTSSSLHYLLFLIEQRKLHCVGAELWQESCSLH